MQNLFLNWLIVEGSEEKHIRKQIVRIHRSSTKVEIARTATSLATKHSYTSRTSRPEGQIKLEFSAKVSLPVINDAAEDFQRKRIKKFGQKVTLFFWQRMVTSFTAVLERFSSGSSFFLNARSFDNRFAEKFLHLNRTTADSNPVLGFD